MSRPSDFRRRACSAAALLSSLVLLAVPLAAQTCTAPSSNSLDLKSDDWSPILTKRGLDAKKQDLAVLVFDHSASSWFVYHHSPGKGLELQSSTFGPDGNPLVLRSGSEKLLLLVTRTNPFLYAYEGVVLPPQDSPDAAALRTLAGALGTAASAITKTVGLRAVTREPPLPESLNEAKTSLENLQQSLVKADDIRQAVRTFVQAFEFEFDSAKPTGIPLSDAIDQSERDVLAGFAGVRDARPGLNQNGLPAACFQSWATFLSLLALPAPADADVDKAIDELFKWSETVPPSCSQSVIQKKAVLKGIRSATGNVRQSLLNKLREDTDLAEIRAVLIIDQALAGEKDAVAALASANAFVRVADDYLGKDKSGNYTVLSRSCVAVLSPPFPDQTWLKDNPGTLSIKAEGAVCGDCTRLRPAVTDKKYLLGSRRQNVLGVGFGLIYTTITDPTFGAVKGINDTQVIARTSEDSRAGAFAVFGSLRVRSAFFKKARPTWWEPCIDVGAGLDVSKPSLFYGASIEILRYVRFGFGLTSQVVTRLDDGQLEAQYGSNGLPVPGTGTAVSSSADIRTRKTVTSRPYLSLTFAVDALPFFQPK